MVSPRDMALRILPLGWDRYPASKDKQDPVVYGVQIVCSAVDQVCLNGP